MTTDKPAVLGKTHRKLLTRLVVGPREHVASDGSYPVLERRGLVRRVGGPRQSRMYASSVIVWEITAAGLAMLQGG